MQELLPEVVIDLGPHGVVRDDLAGGKLALLDQGHAGEGFRDGAACDIDQTDLAVLTGCRECFSIGTEGHAVDATRHLDAGQLLHVLRHKVLNDLFLVGVLALHPGFEHRFQLLGQRAIKLRAVEVHAAFAFVAGSSSDAFSIGGVGNAEDAALHRWEFADEVGVVPNHAFREPLHSIDLRNTVGPADEHFLAGGVTGERLNAALEGTGRD